MARAYGDLAEREAMLQRVEKAAREWQFTVDAIDSAVILLDDERRILRANRQALEMSGLARFSDLVGKPLAIFGGGEPWRGATRLVDVAVSKEMPMLAQTTDESAGRTWRVSVMLPPRGKEEARAVVVITEVTAIVEMQASMRRHDAMAELGRIVGGVAHEVRTPLFAISALFELLEPSIDRSDPRLREGTERLREQIARLSDLMRDLLEYGKAPSLTLGRALLDGALLEAIAQNAPEAARRRLRIENEYPPDAGNLLIDSARMELALRNVIENALQHAPAGSAVTIRGGRSETGEEVWVAVEDRGPGFPPDALRSAFEPFFSRRAGGTGLGLAIVHRIVTLHGGRLSAENRAEGGARVVIALPRAE